MNDRLVALPRPAGWLLLVHERSMGDDDAGMTLKAFGARTVHDALAAHRELRVEANEERPTFRATLLRRLPAG